MHAVTASETYDPHFTTALRQQFNPTDHSQYRRYDDLVLERPMRLIFHSVFTNGELKSDYGKAWISGKCDSLVCIMVWGCHSIFLITLEKSFS